MQKLFCVDVYPEVYNLNFLLTFLIVTISVPKTVSLAVIILCGCCFHLRCRPQPCQLVPENRNMLQHGAPHRAGAGTAVLLFLPLQTLSSICPHICITEHSVRIKQYNLGKGESPAH